MNEWEWQLLEDKTPLEHILISGAEIRAGDRVRLFPRKGGDILDLALRGQIATIESIEQDYEGKAHVSVVLDDDPGRDLGLLRQPGHRFFFDASEVEPLSHNQERAKEAVVQARILVAGIGNIFLGDDGFGVEVARQLADARLPSIVRVADFGIRGLDLAYALQDGYEATILVDAFPHGEAPGTVYVVEPDLSNPDDVAKQATFVEPHAMNPVNVLRLAAAMNAPLKRIFLVGCEPASLGGEDGEMGLSAPVEAAVQDAVRVVAGLIERILGEMQPNATNQG